MLPVEPKSGETIADPADCMTDQRVSPKRVKRPIVTFMTFSVEASTTGRMA